MYLLCFIGLAVPSYSPMSFVHMPFAWFMQLATPADGPFCWAARDDVFGLRCSPSPGERRAALKDRGAHERKAGLMKRYPLKCHLPGLPEL